MSHPYKQGALDQFCGVYSIVNSYQLIYDKFNDDDAYDLIHKIISYLDQKGRLKHVFKNGMNKRDLYGILKHVTVKKYGIQFRRPFLRTDPSHREYWDQIREFLSQEGRSVIILLENHVMSHWSVIWKMEGNQIRLCDSLNTNNFDIKNTSISIKTRTKPYFLEPSDTFFLGKAE